MNFPKYYNKLNLSEVKSEHLQTEINQQPELAKYCIMSSIQLLYNLYTLGYYRVLFLHKPPWCCKPVFKNCLKRNDSVFKKHISLERNPFFLKGKVEEHTCKKQRTLIQKMQRRNFCKLPIGSVCRGMGNTKCGLKSSHREVSINHTFDPGHLIGNYNFQKAIGIQVSSQSYHFSLSSAGIWLQIP